MIKKLISLTLVLSILTTTGCSIFKTDKAEESETENENSSALLWEQHADEPIEFDWYINFSWYNTPWGNNYVSEAITKDTGVRINFITPMGSESEKLNSMIAANTLPDIVTLGWWESQLQDMIDQELVYALNELADKYDPYFYQVTDEQVVNWYTKDDGNIYCYPNSFYTPANVENEENTGSNQVFLVRKDIYEAIGSPDMTTPEGFKTAIRKAVEIFPEIDGKPLIPIGSDEFTSIGCNSFDKYLQNFLAVPYEKDGEYYDRYTDPDYIEWLKVFRQLNSEGYLLDEIFVDKRVQLQEKFAEGRYFCLFYQSTDIQDEQKILKDNKPESVYIAVDGPRNSKGDDPVLPSTGINGWTVTLISKNCKDPERAIAFMDYMISEEGQKKVYLGVEGVTYDVVDNEYVIKPEVKELLLRNRDQFNKIYGSADAYWMLQNNVMQDNWVIFDDSIADLKAWTQPYTKYTAQYDMVFEADTEFANIKSEIESEWSKTLPKLLLAETEEQFDVYLNEFIQKRDELGFDKLMQESTVQMNKLKEKLGLE